MMGALFGRLANPVVAVLVGVVLNVAIWSGLWYGGKWVGYAQGVTDQRAEQAVADAVGGDEIRERVRDALDQVGLDASSSDVDAILRKLGGQ